MFERFTQMGIQGQVFFYVQKSQMKDGKTAGTLESHLNIISGFSVY